MGVVDLLTVLAIVAGLIALYFIIQAVLGAFRDGASAIRETSDAIKSSGLGAAEKAGEAVGYAAGLEDGTTAGSVLGLFNIYSYPQRAVQAWSTYFSEQ